MTLTSKNVSLCLKALTGESLYHIDFVCEYFFHYLVSSTSPFCLLSCTPLHFLPTRFKSLPERLLRLRRGRPPVLEAQPTLERLFRTKAHSRWPHPSLIPSR